nr:cGMP-dependent protein kinase, isozyme 1-like [Leptinotarsa decemlineata]
MLFCRAKRRSSSVKLETLSMDSRRSGVISKSVDINVDDVNIEDIKTYPKSKGEEDLIRKAIEENEFLSSILSEKRLQKIVECMKVEKVSEGQMIIKEGVVGSDLYISVSGSYQVIVGDNVVNTFHDVRVFGELAILYSAKRYASVKSLENGSVWVLDCPTFKRLMIKTAIEEHEEMASFLRNVPQLNTAVPEKLYQVANLLQSEFFPSGTDIVRQGEIGDKFYIIRAGSVTIEKDQETVAHLSKGNYFGELALLKEEFRQATVIADMPGTECLTLTRKQFIDHFGDIDEFIRLKMHPVTEIEKAEFTSFQLDDLQEIQTLGLGAYGRVKLVQHKRYKNLVFALKSSRKVDISLLSNRSGAETEELI